MFVYGINSVYQKPSRKRIVKFGEIRFFPIYYPFYYDPALGVIYNPRYLGLTKRSPISPSVRSKGPSGPKTARPSVIN